MKQVELGAPHCCADIRISFPAVSARIGIARALAVKLEFLVCDGRLAA